MRESPIELSRVELSVGDSVRMEDQILTVLDISEDEVTFRIDTVEDFESENLESDYYVVCPGEEGTGEEGKRLPPR